MILETSSSLKYFYLHWDILNLGLFPRLVRCVAKNPCANVGGSKAQGLLTLAPVPIPEEKYLVLLC